jgi:methionine biosynthesis protein MetW
MITRADLAAIAQWVQPNSRVLDLGCGDGTLLKHLQDTHKVSGYGVEISDDNWLASLNNGINVLQMDLEAGLSAFESDSFDHVVLSQTLQAMHRTELVLKEMLRVGHEGIVTFPNFGFWRHRLDILRGHMPVSRELPYQWYDTPNVHLCTLDDFESLCDRIGIRIAERLVLTGGKTISTLPNLLGEIAVYRCQRS